MKFIFRFIKVFSDDDLIGLAAEAAFFIMLSLLPLLIIVISLLDKINFGSDPYLSTYLLPKSITQIFESTAQTINYSSKITIISALASIWSASNGIWGLMRGIYSANKKERIKSKIKYRFVATLFTVGFALAILTSLAVVVLGELLFGQIQHFIYLSAWVWNIFRYLITIGIVFIFIVFLYYFTPKCKCKLRQLFPGALMVSLGWVAVSLGFEVYVNNFSKYSNVYGGIGAFIGLLMWLFIISAIIIAGAEVNAILLERKTKRIYG